MLENSKDLHEFQKVFINFKIIHDLREYSGNAKWFTFQKSISLYKKLLQFKTVCNFQKVFYKSQRLL